MKYFETIIIGILVGWFIIYPMIFPDKQPEYKHINLPEEFNQIQSGDTINVYTIGDTTFIRFIPPNSICNNKTIVRI